MKTNGNFDKGDIISFNIIPGWIADWQENDYFEIIQERQADVDFYGDTVKILNMRTQEENIISTNEIYNFRIVHNNRIKICVESIKIAIQKNDTTHAIDLLDKLPVYALDML